MIPSSDLPRSRWLVLVGVFAVLIGLPLLLHTPSQVPPAWGPALAPLDRAFDARWKQRFLELRIHRVDTACMTEVDPQVCYLARDAAGKVLGAYRVSQYPVPSFENYAPPSIVFHFVRKGVSFEVHSPLLQPAVAPVDAERVLDEVLGGLTAAVETRTRNGLAWTVDPEQTAMCVRGPEPAETSPAVPAGTSGDGA